MSLLLGGFNTYGTLPTKKQRLAGRVQVNGVGSKKRIAVLKRGTFEYVASGQSNPDGTWEIRGIPEMAIEQLLVFYIDDTRSFNPIAFDYISLEE